MQMQTNVGWSHELNADTVLNIDYVNSLGRDLNFRPRVNQRIPGTTIRRISALLPTPLSPDINANRPAVSRGESEYNGLITSVRRRLSKGMDFTASYTLQKGESNIGNASDELNTANIQDREQSVRRAGAVRAEPDDRRPAPRSACRRSFNLPWRLQRRAGVLLSLGAAGRSDRRPRPQPGRRRDGNPGAGVQGDRLRQGHRQSRRSSDIGACETVNCGRGWSQSQMNIRVSKTFRLGGRVAD